MRLLDFIKYSATSAFICFSTTCSLNSMNSDENHSRLFRRPIPLDSRIKLTDDSFGSLGIKEQFSIAMQEELERPIPKKLEKQNSQPKPPQKKAALSSEEIEEVMRLHNVEEAEGYYNQRLNGNVTNNGKKGYAQISDPQNMNYQNSNVQNLPKKMPTIEELKAQGPKPQPENLFRDSGAENNCSKKPQKSRKQSNTLKTLPPLFSQLGIQRLLGRKKIKNPTNP